MVAACGGCASLCDVPRTIVGYSTRDLEAARANAVYQIYSPAETQVFSAVLLAARKERYTVFMKEEARGLIVLMNIPGVVDTTEVAVFLSNDPAGKGTKVEIASRSTPAKRAVALAVFPRLSDLLTDK